MKNTVFPNAKHYQVPRALYVAAWKVWFKRFANHDDWREGLISIEPSDLKLHQLIETDHRFSLEALNRLMVPWSARDDSQVNDAFFIMNLDMLKRMRAKTESTTKSADSEEAKEYARLTDQALDFWDGLTYLEQDLFTSYAEARIQADIETPTNQAVVLDDAGLVIIGEDIYPPIIPDKTASDRDFAHALVAWIDDDPFTPMYQRQPVADAVSSWHDRLEAFFWPKPRNGLMQVSHCADALMYRAAKLSQYLAEGKAWTAKDKAMAVKTTNEIFLQAGVPQSDVTWQNIQAVMLASINEDVNSTAKMNSGWSLLASFSTHWLNSKEDRNSMVCWNSRVATSVLSRLDFIMVEAGFESLEGRFDGLGIVPGVGGTRPREMSLLWPDGYRCWKSQIAASRFVNLLVHCLNNERNSDGTLKYKAMPIPTGGRAPWSVQGVQLVLFSDGY